MAKHMPVQGNKGEEGSFMDLGGSIVNKESIRGKQKVESRVTFHWLSLEVSNKQLAWHFLSFCLN